jgi:hypothetical protein
LHNLGYQVFHFNWTLIQYYDKNETTNRKHENAGEKITLLPAGIFLKPETFQLISRLSIMMLGVMMVAPSAEGMVYMWRDSTGIAYYSNKEYDIPVRYKTNAKALYPEASDSGQSQPNNANTQSAGPVAQSQPITSQQSRPAERPNERPAVTSPSKQNSLPRTTSKRVRIPRVRSDEE